MTATFERLRNLARAGANVLHIASFEWERVHGIARGLGDALNLPVRVWSQSGGVRRVEGESAILEGDRRTDPQALLEQIHGGDETGIWLLEDFQPFLREEHHELVRWVRELTRLPPSPRKLVLLSTPLAGLPVDLRKEVPTVELPLPDIGDLRFVRDDVVRELGLRSNDDEAILEAARGLTVMEAKLAFGAAAVQLGRLDHTAVPLVAREKERIIKQSDVLEYYPSEATFDDVGGLDNLKLWLARRGKAFSSGAQKYGLDAPKGVLLLGVQGCGKSLLAKAIATTWQFPLLRFDMGKVFGGIVGQSESNIRSALQVAEALAPCVLWVDEIEKGLAGMGSSDRSDGGTTARVVGTLLTWMQEKRAPVFVVATANRIEMLPPELLRKGRFDELFFVDLPTKEVRAQILAIHLKRKGRDPADYDLAALARASVGYSGAELEEAVREGLFDAFSESDKGVELATRHITRALEATYPLSRTMHDEIEALRSWAKTRARLASSVAAEPLPSGGVEVAAPKLKQEMRSAFVPKDRS